MKYLVFLLLFLGGELSGQVAGFSWQDFSLGTPALTFKVPFYPLPQEVSLPQSVADYIRQYDAFYIKEPERGIVVTIMHVIYNDDITADVNGAVQGTIAQWRANNAQVEIQAASLDPISGKNAVRQMGRFVQDGKENRFANVVVGEGSKLWQLIIIVKAGDPNLQKAMDTMLSSLAFK
jgi:hypothetical protein